MFPSIGTGVIIFYNYRNKIRKYNAFTCSRVSDKGGSYDPENYHCYIIVLRNVAGEFGHLFYD